MDIASLNAEFSKLQAEVTASVETGTTLTAEVETENEKKFARMDEINKIIETHNKATEKKFAGGIEIKPETEIVVKDNAFDRQAFNKSTFDWFKNGSMDQKFTTITTATSSGIIYPKSVDKPIVAPQVNPFRAAHEMYGVKVVTTTGTASTVYPLLTLADGTTVAENNTTAGTENDPAVGNSIVLNAALYSSNPVYFSNTELASLDYNILDNLLPEMESAKEAALASAIVTGLKADSNAKVVTLATATAAGLTYAKLQNARRKVATRWQSQQFLVLSEEAFNAVEGMVDTAGRPIMVQDPQNNELVRVLGCPAFRHDGFDAFAAAKVVGAVITLKGFKMRDAGAERLARYVNIPARRDSTGLELFANHGHGWVSDSVTLIKTP